MRTLFGFVWTRRFLPLFLTQFMGAFNDNLFKNAVVMLITYRLADVLGHSAQVLVTISAGVFILPYFLFSALAGQLADRYERSHLARIIKIAEIVLMILACIGFVFSNAWFLMTVLFCLGAQATFFGPIKYALLPQHLQKDELLGANACIGAGTFLTILLGTIAGGLLILYPYGDVLICLAIMACALIGYATCRAIPRAPAPDPTLVIRYNFMAETFKLLGAVKKDAPIYATITAISWFWFVGATYLSQFPPYAKNILHADETVVTTFLTLFSVGIGIGSFLCNVLLKGKITTAYVPFAALGLSVFSADLYWASQTPHLLPDGALMGITDFIRHPQNWRILGDMLLISIFGGIYIVPLYAFLQAQSDPHQVARMVAANNIMNAIYMVGSAVAVLGMIALGLGIPHVFLVLAVVNACFGVYVYRKRLIG